MSFLYRFSIFEQFKFNFAITNSLNLFCAFFSKMGDLKPHGYKNESHLLLDILCKYNKYICIFHLATAPKYACVSDHFYLNFSFIFNLSLKSYKNTFWMSNKTCFTSSIIESHHKKIFLVLKTSIRTFRLNSVHNFVFIHCFPFIYFDKADFTTY